MNQFGGGREPWLAAPPPDAGEAGVRIPGRVRAGAIVAATAVLLAAGATVTLLPALAHRGAPQTGSQTVADTMSGPMPSAAPSAMATAPPAPMASAAPAGQMATGQMAASQLTVGPGTMSAFAQTGAWTAASGGSPGFMGPDRWAAGTTAPDATARWSLGSPAGGQGWNQVRVRVWIPNQHAQAWVRYTVTTTSAGMMATSRTFDVQQQPLNGWYTLPATFAVGTATRRTGTLTLSIGYLRPATAMGMGMNAGGTCEFAAAQAQFLWG